MDESQNREGPKIRVQSPSKRTISVEDFGASSILRHPKQRKIPLLGTPNALYNNFLYTVRLPQIRQCVNANEGPLSLPRDSKDSLFRVSQILYEIP